MLYDLSEKVSVRSNTTATLLNLINLGDTWAVKSQSVCETVQPDLRSGFDRVVGCMADVRIKTNILLPDVISIPRIEAKIIVEGTADSRVAQGLLALLSMVKG
jgi:hypothetical protein